MSIRDYKITDEQFNEKGMTSLPDTLNGTPYENKKSLEKFTREVVAPQFNAIVEVFARMEESTGNWSAEEAQRVQQENARQSAEQGRVSAEGQRKTSETARLSAEENRISAENDRVTAETARVNAENKRDSAEKSRVSAENARNVWQTYDAAKTYVPGNKVSFGGSSYVCTAETVGHEPTDAAYWLLIAQKGMDGAGADDLRQINNALDAIDPTKVTTKAAPADGDGVMIADSTDGGKAKRLLWSNVKAALGKLFVPLARTVNGKALSTDVTLTGENIAVSTTDSTPISGAVKYRTNPNLLDNWFFGRPVNQRGQVEYTGGYGIDRWRILNVNKMSVQSDCVIFTFVDNNYIAWERLENLVSGTYTLSLLFKDGTLVTNTKAIDVSQTSYVIDTPRHNEWNVQLHEDKTVRITCTGNSGDTAAILAAKLELGDTQTLAHKDSSGNWILNEIPDFGEQLRRCQRYCRVYKVGTTLPCLAYPQMDGGWYASAGLPTNGMRTIPTNNLGDGKKIAITDLDGADATHDDMSMTNWGQNENMLCLRISGGSHGVLTSKFPYWIKLKEDLILSADL